MEYFNTNAGGFQAIFSICLFVVTTFYAIISYKMLKEMKILRLKAEDPDISLNFIRKTSTLIDIEIRNISHVAIYDLKFIEYPKLTFCNNYTTDRIGLFKNGLKYFDINQIYSTLFIDLFKYQDEVRGDGFDLKFEIEFYKDSTNNTNRRRYMKSFDINLNLLDCTTSDKDYLKEISSSLEIISKSIDNLNNINPIKSFGENNEHF